MTKFRLVRAPDGSWERVYEFDDGTTASTPHVEALEGLVDQLGKLHRIKDVDHAAQVKRGLPAAVKKTFAAHGAKKAGQTFDARAKAVQELAEAMRKDKPSLGLEDARADAVAEWNQKHKAKRPYTVTALKRALTRAKKRAR